MIHRTAAVTSLSLSLRFPLFLSHFPFLSIPSLLSLRCKSIMKVARAKLDLIKPEEINMEEYEVSILKHSGFLSNPFKLFLMNSVPYNVHRCGIRNTGISARQQSSWWLAWSCSRRKGETANWLDCCHVLLFTNQSFYFQPSYLTANKWELTLPNHFSIENI